MMAGTLNLPFDVQIREGAKGAVPRGGYGSFGRTTDTPSHYFLASWAGVMMTPGAVVTHAGPSRTTQCVEGHSVVTTFFNCTFLVRTGPQFSAQLPSQWPPPSSEHRGRQYSMHSE